VEVREVRPVTDRGTLAWRLPRNGGRFQQTATMRNLIKKTASRSRRNREE
jgi:hypothetical protein